MFSPSGIGLRPANFDETSVETRVGTLGQGYLHVRSRLRITRDGGHSRLAVRDASNTTRLDRVSIRDSPAKKTVDSDMMERLMAPIDGPSPSTSTPSISASPAHFAALLNFLRIQSIAGLKRVPFKTARKFFRDKPEIYGGKGSELNALFTQAGLLGLVLVGGTGKPWMELWKNGSKIALPDGKSRNASIKLHLLTAANI